jgi:hypothetical protein
VTTGDKGNNIKRAQFIVPLQEKMRHIQYAPTESNENTENMKNKKM